MSESNRTAVRVVKETSFRVPPANPIYKGLRFNSASIGFTPQTTASDEIDSGRMVKDLILTGYEAGGDVGSEYSIENLDVVMEGAMCNVWLRSPEILNGKSWKYGGGSSAVTRITAVSGTAFTVLATSVLAGSAVAAATTVFKAGHLVRGTGFGTNNGLFPVTASTGTTITATGLVVEASPPATARLKVVGFQGTTGDIVATTSGGYGLTSTTLDFTTMGIVVGQYVKLSEEGGAYGFATAGVKGYCRVSGIAAQRLSFDIVPPTFAADAGTGKTIRVYFSDSIRNGVLAASYRIEKQYELASGTKFVYDIGQEVNSLAITGETRATMTTTVNFTGSESTKPIARDTGASTEEVNANTVLDTSNSVPLLLENGAVVTSPNFMNSFAFTLENALRAQTGIGQAGAVGIGLGRSSLTGTVNFYFGDETMLNKLIDNTASSLTFVFRDRATFEADLWDIPRIKYSSGVPEIGGVDQDLSTNLGFQAIRDVAGGRDYTVMLSRFDYQA